MRVEQSARPALLPLLLLQPTRLIGLTGFHRPLSLPLPSLPTALSTGRALSLSSSSCFSRASSFSSSRYRYVTNERRRGKKRNMKRVTYETRGRKREGEEEKGETMRADGNPRLAIYLFRRAQISFYDHREIYASYE